MKKTKLFINIFILVAISSIVSVFAYSIFADDVGFTPIDSEWDVENVDESLNDLHTKINSVAFKKICAYKESNYAIDPTDRYSIGTKYECDPGDGVKRGFYILNVSNETVKLIMEHNVTEGTSQKTVNWRTAMAYVTTKNMKTSWNNVIDVDLPGAQEIANAVGNTTWNVTTASANDRFCLKSKVYDNAANNARCKNTTEQCWLHDYLYFDYEYHCPHILASTEAYGYWTKNDIINTAYAWRIHSSGSMSDMEFPNDGYMGVRLVITIFKSNIL